MVERNTRQALLLLLCGAGTLMAGPTLTTIEDTLYRADGTKFNGVVFVEWKSFDAADATSVPSRTLTTRVTDGLLRLALVPTTNATPGAYYRVRFNSDGRTDFVEYWAVPPSATPLRLRDVRTSGPQSSGGPTPPVNTAIVITDVSGLRDELDNRPSKGGSFLPGHVVIANEDGSLDTVSGIESDCVRVDGTSGPCGGEGYRYVDAETPGGAIDGVNPTFTLAAMPKPRASLSMYRNGLLLAVRFGLFLDRPALQFTPGVRPASPATCFGPITAYPTPLPARPAGFRAKRRAGNRRQNADLPSHECTVAARQACSSSATGCCKRRRSTMTCPARR